MLYTNNIMFFKYLSLLLIREKMLMVKINLSYFFLIQLYLILGVLCDIGTYA